MAVKMELLRQVTLYLLDECSPSERAEFYDKLRKEMGKPFSQTQATTNPDLSRYRLHRFDFGRHVAFLAWIPAQDMIKVVKCQRL